MEANKTYSLKKKKNGKDCQKQIDETLGGCKSCRIMEDWVEIKQKTYKGDVQQSGKEQWSSLPQAVLKKHEQKYTKIAKKIDFEHTRT